MTLRLRKRKHTRNVPTILIMYGVASPHWKVREEKVAMQSSAITGKKKGTRNVSRSPRL